MRGNANVFIYRLIFANFCDMLIKQEVLMWQNMNLH